MRRASAFRDGAETLTQRARPSVVFLTIAKHTPVFAILFAPPALWAMIEGQMQLFFALIMPACAAIAFYLGARTFSLPEDLRGIEAMVTVALIFLLAALLSVPTFLVLGMTPFDAFFEAMSGITTTGLSVAQTPDEWPFAAHMFRAWLQWTGGLVMATAVLALLLPSGLPARRLGRAGMDHGDRIASTRRQAQELLGVYVILTAVMAFVTMSVIPDWREAIALTLSGISTGGFAPRSDSLASYSKLGQGVVLLTCVLGTISLLTIVLLWQRKPSDAWALGSIQRVFTAILFLSGVYIAVLLAQGQSATDNIYGKVLNLISGLTTAGYSTGAIPATGSALAIFIFAMAMGGDVGSTGGGIKLLRVGILFRAMRHALRAPAMPDSAVVPLRHGGKPIDDTTLVSLLALIIIYVSVMLLVWLHFLAHGYPAGAALFDTISTLSTVGLSTLVGPELPADLKFSLTVAMWLGRLEFIAVLVLLVPRTWYKRS